MRTKDKVIAGILMIATQCYGAAIHQLKIPKGLTFPAMKKIVEPVKSKVKATVKKKHMYKAYDERLEPPKRMVTRSYTEPTVMSMKIQGHSKLSDTEHMAVVLKNNGYRLYKKRTLWREKNWMYWLKNKEGTPLFKVELVWTDSQKKYAEVNLWSWDDTTQINLKDRESLIKIFGEELRA